MKSHLEPKEAFPYMPPSIEIQRKYRHIFELNDPLPPRFFKVFFDKVLSSFLLLLSAPVFLLLKCTFLIEGWLIPDNAGPMFFHYNAISAGRIIPKYKIRLIKTRYIEPEGAMRGDWLAYSAEWTPESRTHVGQIVKMFYLLIKHFSNKNIIFIKNIL